MRKKPRGVVAYPDSRGRIVGPIVPNSSGYVPMSQMGSGVRQSGMTLTIVNGVQAWAFPSTDTLPSTLVSNTADIVVANTEKVLAGMSIPANSIKEPMVFTWKAAGTLVYTGGVAYTSIARVRAGVGSLIGTIGVSGSAASTKTHVTANIDIEADLNIRSVGALGSAIACVNIWGDASAAFSDVIAVGAPFLFNTLIANQIELTLVSGNALAVITIPTAYIE